ncbi:MAG: hypothetical protein IIA62_10335 [Nitrospinae bacterium]|nr:hypothetical protein [Nitrospinota bacterium]
MSIFQRTIKDLKKLLDKGHEKNDEKTLLRKNGEGDGFTKYDGRRKVFAVLIPGVPMVGLSLDVQYPFIKLKYKIKEAKIGGSY